MIPPVPRNNSQRLEALRSYGILDTPPEEAFDGIARLIAHVCRAPIAVINFIDEGRQWFKSEVGLGVRETPLDVSICAHAIHQPGLFVVPDTTKDERFACNPLVASDPHLRFYAGALLETADGHALGTLCVLDHVPRDLDEAQKDALRTLARQVMAQLELRRELAAQARIQEEFRQARDAAERANRVLSEGEARNAAILETALDAIVTMDHRGNVVEWNPAAERIFGHERAAALGREMAEFIIPPPLRDAHRRGLARHLATGEGPVLGRRIEITALRAGGSEFPVELAIVRIPGDGPPLFTAHVRDITDRKAFEQRRNARLAVTQALAEAATVEEAAPRILRAVGEGLGWGVGVLWLADPDGHTLRCAEFWHAPSARVGEFEAITRRTAFARGEGLPGRIWSAGRPVWIEDVVRDTGFPRCHSAAREGLHGAFGFPIRLREQTLGVVEFFSRGVREPDADLLEMAETLGVQAGQFVERMRSEVRLRESEARLRRIFESNAVGLVYADFRGRIIEANDAFLAIVGYTRDDLRSGSLNWAAITPPEYIESDRRAMDEMVRRGRHAPFEKEYVRKDGSRVQVLVGTAYLGKDRAGDEFGVGFILDLTGRKEAERALREGEERFRTMAESIPQLAWMARPDGHIYWYNQRWYDYTGTTPEQMEGWGWQAVHDPEVLPSVLGRWRASIASGEPFDMVFPLKGADGRFRPFLTRVMPVRGEAGRVAHWFGTNTDISERLRIEEELRSAKEEAEAANRAKTQFLAVLSHELRTPLNPILLAASSMLDRPTPPEGFRPMLEMIRHNVNLQARLIDDLLDVMRIVRGKMPLHWGIADCHEVIGHALQVCRSEVFGGELRVEMDRAAAHHHVNADAARLQQVFWNLIKNAVKFSPEGGTLAIRTRNEGGDGGDRLVIEVSDTGIGIEPDVLPTIWDPFQQGESSITRRFGGLGLGLAICKGIVEAHGGTIEAESGGKGRGTTFRIVLGTLPDPAVEGDGQPPDAHATPAGVELPAAPLKILVVEDEETTRRLMARLLRGQGHEITTAGTLAEATEASRAGDFDLIVSDIGLPDGSGLDLMRRVVAVRGEVPSIALTGYGMEEDIVRSREAGFTAHMTKPIDFTKLEAMIRQVAAPRR